jgi:gustatory receptor
MTGSLVQAYVICWYAERLQQSSGKIAVAAYNNIWYEKDVKMQKSFQIIILRAQNPQNITAFKFANVSIATFTRILSSAYSYYTVMKSLV